MQIELAIKLFKFRSHIDHHIQKSPPYLSMVTDSDPNHPVSIFFIPLMTPGHMNPTMDMAKLFALRLNTSVAVITTPGNVPTVRSSLHSFPINIDLITVHFPPHVSHFIPRGKENLSLLTNSEFPDFFHAFYALQDPIEEILYAHRPDCIIADYMFHWMTDTAAKLNIPRFVFYGHGIFTSCVHDSLEIHKPYETVSDDEQFVVEGNPHRIRLFKSEVSMGVRYSTKEREESADNCFGIVVNSYYGLEPEYADLYRSGGRRYYVGPVAMVNEGFTKEARKFSAEVDEVMTWLNSVPENSVVYACFGSLNEFCNEQLREIGLGLERSGHRFIWVARNIGDECLPGGFEERMKGVGVVIRGWAPQTMILDHKAVGGFVTHCGWNSTLESIVAGVPMAAWPVEYEQFVNEKLITKVLRVGVSVRDGERVEEIVKAEKVAGAVRSLLGDGEEAEEIRGRVRDFAVMAREAVKEGGSSYGDVSRLIDEVMEWRFKKCNGEVGP